MLSLKYKTKNVKFTKSQFVYNKQLLYCNVKLYALSKYIMYRSDMYILYIIILFEWIVYDDVDVLFVRLHIIFVNN